MRNIKLVIEYDGTDFLGWQIQEEGRTVQGELQEALKCLIQENPKIYAAGRTDAGVHALGQVVNFKINNSIAIKSIYNGLNFYLPRDVRIINAETVDADFNARFSAINRVYKYCITTQHKAISRQYAWYCKYKLEISKIKEASEYLIGEHSFTAFAKKNEEEPHYLSNIEYIQWEEDGASLTMEICANRFLHNMVRIIVGTLIQVGRGEITPADVRKILTGGDRTQAGFTVPPYGLFLVKVNY